MATHPNRRADCKTRPDLPPARRALSAMSWSRARVRHYPSWTFGYWQLIGAVKWIALASKDLRLSALEAAAAVAAQLVHDGDLDLHVAVDRLQQAAEAYGLVDDHGQDAVQQALADGFRP